MDDYFKLRINAYTPETIPMRRLTEYMLPFAALLGNESRAHFKGLRKSSTTLCVRGDPEDVAKAGERLAKVNHRDAPTDIVRAFNNINALLREDKASATLRRDKAQIVKFPGCHAPVIERIGPVKEAGQLEGKVVSVGGKDRTKHIVLLDNDGEEFRLTTRNIELTKQLGNHLFDRVRVTGAGKWFRNENGKWELDDFLVQNCEPLEDDSLVEAVAALRDIEGDEWKTLPDPLAAWQALWRN
jgi:hypothetical protein